VSPNTQTERPSNSVLKPTSRPYIVFEKRKGPRSRARSNVTSASTRFEARRSAHGPTAPKKRI